MKDVLREASILICMGSGGVGKTTMSSALAVQAAREGRRVLALTIDPSQRLKTILGLETDGTVKTVTVEKGVSFDAAVVNHEQVFAAFVGKALEKSPAEARKILDNRLYRQLVSHLSGSQEFTSLQRLYQGHAEEKYDLVILDTPPAQHAIDFLNAPQKLAALFHEGIVKWFRAPEGGSLLRRVVQAGTTKALGVIEMLTGAQFFRELTDFFRNVHSWSDRLEARLVDIHRLLVHPKTHFVLVSSHDAAKLAEAEAFAKELKRGGHRLSAIILNRTHPLWVGEAPPEDLRWKGLFGKFRTYYAEKQKLFDHWKQLKKIDCPVYQIPQMLKDVENIKDVAAITEHLEGKA